jgi:hypothetical protein
MPQIIKPKTYVFRDSLQQDTIWLDMDKLPAKVYNPLDTPDLVLFNVDSAIAHQVRWNGVDTFALHQMERKDTVLKESFLNVYVTPGKDGTPEKSSQPTTQLILAASVLLILFASLAIIFSQSKNRIFKYFLSIFDKRRFKEYVMEENPRLFPTMPLIYILQSALLGSVTGFWLFNMKGEGSGVELVWISVVAMLGFALIPLIRNSAIYLLGNIFMIQHDVRKHIFISYLTHTLLFMLVLPLALQLAIQVPQLDPYFNVAFYTCIALAMGYQLVKLVQNTSLPDLGALLYIFLYFCTLEILPLVLVYKVAVIYA